MKLTKLKIVQDILSTLDLDEVNSIGETVESEQISYIVDSIYDDMNGHKPWPHLREFSALEITTTANKFKIPDNIITVNDVWYNGEELSYKTPKEMIQLLLDRDITESNIDDEGAYNDRDPVYWSSYDDTNIIVDAYDSSLVSSLSLADMYHMPSQMTADTDYPELPERFHSTLYHGALADAFYTLKGDQVGFNIYNNRHKRGKIAMNRWAKRVNRERSTGDNVNYGRKHS